MNIVNLIKKNFFNIGIILTITATIFIGLFLSEEKLDFISITLSLDIDLVKNFIAGFLLSGFISLFLGFIFTITFLYTLPEESDIKKPNTIRVKIILITIIIVYFILLGYFLSVNPLSLDSKWTIKSLIIEKIAGIPIEPSYAFYPEITLTSTNLLYATLIILGIVVLPVTIAELGFLDFSNKQYDDANEQPIEGEETYDRFVSFLKNHLNSVNVLKKAKNIKRIKDYSLQFAITNVIVGVCFILLPPFLIKDGPVAYEIRKGVWWTKAYMGVARGQLLLLGVLLIVITIILLKKYRKKQ